MLTALVCVVSVDVFLLTFLSSSAYNMPSFEAGAQLLSSLSGYAYTKRAWKKEVFELFMDPLFFTMDASCSPRLISYLPAALSY